MYFDQMYEVFLVRPFIGLSRWLWRVVDVGIFDGLVVGFGRACLAVAVWLWRTVDVRGIPDASSKVVGSENALANASGGNDAKGTAAGLATASVGAVQDETGPGDREGLRALKQRVSGRPLQHQLLIQILWLIAAITFFYWLVLYP